MTMPSDATHRHVRCPRGYERVAQPYRLVERHPAIVGTVQDQRGRGGGMSVRHGRGRHSRWRAGSPG